MDATRWTTVDEEATRLGVNHETVRRWLKQGRIQGAKPDGPRMGWRIAPGEVERMLRAETDAVPQPVTAPTPEGGR